MKNVWLIDWSFMLSMYDDFKLKLLYRMYNLADIPKIPVSNFKKVNCNDKIKISLN